ncbi:MAG: R3H domain-containing nucleic acid-binding protein [Candidatus Cloacimonadaceae bacterium]|nr:R3H domain-containing nucleic acid-binding protein [Candidatus Cloacimonadaceae bacterium]MDP3113537.1 R3H domain-containing nucleic acid-binding protein [Candidatus Cloacimonadaceae bacterium]
MTTIEKTGQSIETLIAEFRKEHNLKDWELRYDILKKPSSGFLGLFSNKIAVVRFDLPALEDRVRLFLQKLMEKIGIGFDSVTAKREGKIIYLEIFGCKDPGFLIGKNGTMLETIQFLLNRSFESDRSLDNIYLDAEGYRARRESSFLRPFIPMISKIKAHGKPLTLDPMSAGERRIIHRHVERDRGLRTLTIGEGEKKRIVIFSSKHKESEVLSQAREQHPKRPPRKDDDPKG